MSDWEVTWLDRPRSGFPRRLDDALADGWEPFAVVAVGASERLWLRRAQPLNLTISHGEPS